MNSTPPVSVIVPAYEDPNGLTTTIESLLVQTYDEYEIIAAIRPSNGLTVEAAEELKNPRLSIVTTEIPGPAAGRNVGIEHAKGDIIVFLDADIFVEKEWLSQAVHIMRSKQAKVLACDVRFQDDNNSLFARYDRAIGLPVKHYIDEYEYAPTAALLVAREVIDTVGRFDDRLTSSEDKEFGNRLRQEGIEICFSSDVPVYHPPRSLLSEHISKSIRIGRGIEQLRHYYPERYDRFGIISPISYLPPNPRRLFSRMRSNKYSPELYELPLFYLINYMMKICQQYGRWMEIRT